MLNLDSVTLIIVDCVDYIRARKSFDWCLSLCKFADCKFLTSLDVKDEFVHKIKPIRSRAEYSKFIIKDLNSYFDTPYVLIIQWDGSIWHTKKWDDVFLRYDYIGAPWASGMSISDKYLVGNGGFSLRSKQLHTILASDKNIIMHPNEDVSICQINRPMLELKYGIKFPNVEIAENFSWECRRRKEAFGFHDKLPKQEWFIENI